jgi:hypothetical protein
LTWAFTVCSQASGTEMPVAAAAGGCRRRSGGRRGRVRPERRRGRFGGWPAGPDGVGAGGVARAAPPSTARPVAGSTAVRRGTAAVLPPAATPCAQLLHRARAARCGRRAHRRRCRPRRGELHQRDLDQDARVGRVAHVDERVPSRSIARTSPAAPSCCAGRDRVDPVGREHHELGRHQRQERVAEVPDDLLGDGARVAAEVDRVGHRGERPARIALDHRDDELVEVDDVAHVAAGGRQQLERRQRVARRPAALHERRVERRLRQLEPGIGGHPLHVLGEGVGRQQVELQVLGPRADRVAHLLRVGGGEHEHHVRRRLLERLQQGRLGRLGEHVDLVEDVHLVAARRAERRLLDEVADGVDAVVADAASSSWTS